MNKLLASSADPTQLSLTVKGIMLGLIPLTLLLTGLANLNVTQEDLTSIIDAVVEAITAATVVVSAVMTVYGIIRKIFYAFKG